MIEQIYNYRSCCAFLEPGPIAQVFSLECISAIQDHLSIQYLTGYHYLQSESIVESACDLGHI